VFGHVWQEGQLRLVKNARLVRLKPGLCHRNSRLKVRRRHSIGLSPKESHEIISPAGRPQHIWRKGFANMHL
jgi:hypothetical protein